MRTAFDRRTRRLLAAIGIVSALALAAAGCDFSAATPTPVPPTATVPAIAPTDTPVAAVTTEPTATTAVVGEVTETPVAAVTPPAVRQAIRFASYNLPATSVNPSLKPYKVEAGLANVSNAKDFPLSSNAKALLEKYAFVAQFPSEVEYKQFYQIYEDGRYAEKPIFVSTDSVLHVYHLMFDKLLRATETNFLIANLKELTAAMLPASREQYTAAKGTPAENAARRNLAYFAVVSTLLDPNFQAPAEVRNEVAEELRLIDEAAGLANSPVMGMGGATTYTEDFSQYKPRGHYTRSDALKQYFRAMMYLGRMTMRLKYPDETRSAILMSQALRTAKIESGKSASDIWASIYEPTAFFVGGADDLTFRDYAPLIDRVYGANPNPRDVADDAKMQAFQQEAKALAAPRINSMFVYIWEDKEDVTKGLRMMGQRFTLDEYVFGQLIWRNVGVNGNERWLPKALDFPAALGSAEAYTVLDQIGETKWPNYAERMQKVRAEIKGLPAEQWSENLYWSWLNTFRPLITTKAPDSGYPSFMTNEAWARKDLNTVLGSWTELKHDTILYAKQVMAEMGGGPPELPKGYVEPEPEFYARVAALVAMTRDGLLARGLLEQKADDPRSEFSALNQLETLALDLKRISEKELEGTALTDDEYGLIQYYGGRLESITIAASDSEGEDGNRGTLADQDAAVVADVATGANQALTEGTGRIMEVYVVAPVEGKLVLVRGGIYSQYEWVQPVSNRLTDEQWRQRLDNKQAPPLDDWKFYIAK